MPLKVLIGVNLVQAFDRDTWLSSLLVSYSAVCKDISLTCLTASYGPALWGLYLLEIVSWWGKPKPPEDCMCMVFLRCSHYVISYTSIWPSSPLAVNFRGGMSLCIDYYTIWALRQACQPEQVKNLETYVKCNINRTSHRHI